MPLSHSGTLDKSIIFPYASSGESVDSITTVSAAMRNSYLLANSFVAPRLAVSTSHPRRRHRFRHLPVHRADERLKIPPVGGRYWLLDGRSDRLGQSYGGNTHDRF